MGCLFFAVDGCLVGNLRFVMSKLYELQGEFCCTRESNEVGIKMEGFP